MDTSPHFGTIRVLKIGNDPRDSMAYTIGQEFKLVGKSVKIDSIETDRHLSEFYRIRAFNIMVNDGKKIFLWKSFEGQPYSVEYEMPTDEANEK